METKFLYSVAIMVNVKLDFHSCDSSLVNIGLAVSTKCEQLFLYTCKWYREPAYHFK